MKNWKIGLRMTAGFGAVICVAMALGVFAYTRVMAIEKSATTVTVDALPGVYVMGQVQSNARKIYSLVLEHVIAQDQAEMARIDSEIQTVSAANTALLAEYGKTVGDQERPLFDAATAARAPFTSSFEEVLRLSRAGKTKEAQELANAQLKGLKKTYADKTDAEVLFNKAGADAAGKSIMAANSSAKTGIVICLVMALIIGIVISILITRSITHPLAVASSLITTVAEGDLRKKADITSRDELGKMVAAVNDMIDNLRKTVGGITAASANVASGSEEMSSTAQQLSQGATEQASAEEVYKSSMEQMGSNMQADADNAQQTEKIARKSAQDAKGQAGKQSRARSLR